MGTSFVARAWGIIAVAIALAGCTTGGTASPAPPPATSAPSATATARPTATPSPSPSAAPSLSALDGKATFAFVVYDENKWKTRCSPGRGVVQVGDSRVAGQYVNLVCLEENDEVAANGFWDFWGRHLIWNDGGTWEWSVHRDQGGRHG